MHEARQAKALGKQLGVRLERSKEAEYDLYDPATGKKYDLKGAPDKASATWLPVDAISSLRKGFLKEKNVIFAIDISSWSVVDLEKFRQLLLTDGGLDKSRIITFK